jgi:sirohydrochlorin ferrochelatase
MGRGSRRASSDGLAFRVPIAMVNGRGQDKDLSRIQNVIKLNERTGVGIVVVDHGSKRESSNVMLDSFVELYKRMLGEEKMEMNIVAIEKAHMEIAAPSVKDAVGACVDKGAKVVVVAPYFLSRGRHILEDIPALVEEAQSEYKDVRCIMAGPIGLDVRVADVVHTRVEEALTALDGLVDPE